MYATSGHEFVPAQCGAEACEQTVGALLGSIQSELMPILAKHKVDIYNAGHIHDYQASYTIICDSGTAR